LSDVPAAAILAIGCAPDGAEENAMTKPSFVHIVVTALFVTAVGPALAVDQTTIDQVVNVAKIGCLLGNEFSFDAKANGEITFTKLMPGAEAGVHTNIKEDPGAPGIIDQQLKLVASQQIRDCMKPYIQKLAELILGQASGNQITSIDASAALNLGDCPSGTGSLWNNYPDRTYSCTCPAMSESEIHSHYIAGTSVYNLGSDICVAAIHSGALKRGQPGKVLLHQVPAPPVFGSTTQNDIKSQSSTSPEKYGFVMAPAE
jgi:LCCL domain